MQNKIYSRRKIKFFKINVFKSDAKNKKTMKFLLIWLLVIFTSVSFIKYLNPIFEKNCLKEANNISTQILNTETTKAIKDIKYEDIIIETKDNNGKIIMVKSDLITINIVASDIAYNIQKEFNQLNNNMIKIPFGSFLGSDFLSGIGPDINIKISPRGNVETTFKSEFVSAGVNQTIHRLYLEIICEMSIITAYSNIETEVFNQLLFAENIIVGEVPDSYYNLEGMTRDDVMEVI